MSEPDPETGKYHPAEGPGRAPKPTALDIGGGHKIEFLDWQGETAGIVDWHRNKDGEWCCGWVAFRQSKWGAQFKAGDVGWNVVQREPLTLSPSLLCKTCGDHGFINEGKWVQA